MNYFYSWLMILTAGMLASMVPGISFALVLRNTLRSSRATGIWTAFGLAVGMSVYALIVLLGLGIVITHHPFLYHLITLGGAIYLAYIGVSCLFAKPRQAAYSDQNNMLIPANKAWRMGFLTNLLNPKVSLFFLALFSPFIRPETPVNIQITYGLTVVCVEFLWFSFVSILLTHPMLHKKFYAASHWIERCSGIVLLGISVELVVNFFDNL